MSLAALLLLFAVDGEGTAVVSPAHSIAGAAGTWAVRYTAGASGLPTGGSIRVEMPTGWSDARWSEPQFVKPDAPHFVSIECSRTGVKLYRHVENFMPSTGKRHWFRRVIYAGVQEGRLQPGDTITVTYRNTVGPVFANEGVVTVLSDLDGDGAGRSLASLPKLVTRAAEPVEMQVIAPSQALAGKPVEVQINIFDRYANIADWSASVRVDGVETRLTGGTARASVTPARAGFQRVAVVSDRFGRVPGNPIRVTEQPERSGIYWGDIHSHTGISEDGSGGDPFPYARDVARLDFYSLTDHLNVSGDALNNFGKVGNDYGEGTLPNEWQWTRRQTDRFYEPGRFVTILGFEYTLIWPWGHHNVFYRHAKADYFVGDKVPTTEALWAALDARRAFTIPHHTGIDWNDGGVTSAAVEWRTRNDRMRPSVEVYSIHGTSELYDPASGISYENAVKRISLDGPHYARDGWRAGHRMGTIASSDNHTAQPGQRQQGLAAVFAGELTREAIFDSLRARRSYGSTGERVWMDFRVEGRAMGEEFAFAGARPEVTFRLAGTGAIDFVEVVKLDLVSKTWRRLGILNPGTEDCEGRFWDEQFSGDAMYYLRMKQRDRVRGREVWAWSSPVWVTKPGSRAN
ncbi:MAG: DUF3604 domain-containing protein, partial [Bryobacteraceae bacterium]